jgi:hypothetical protein
MPVESAAASRWALKLGAIAAIAASLQPWLLLVLGDPDTSSLATIAGDAARVRMLFWVMLLFIPPMFLAYWVAVVDRLARSPHLASLALFFLALWFALELGPRSFDLWVVHGKWASAYPTSVDASREWLERAYATYRDVQFAVVFVRRHALLGGQLCLAVLLGSSWRWGFAVSAALALSVLRLALGTLVSYGGWRALESIVDPLYFISAGLVFPLLAAWLWRRSTGRQQ